MLGGTGIGCVCNCFSLLTPLSAAKLGPQLLPKPLNHCWKIHFVRGNAGSRWGQCSALSSLGGRLGPEAAAAEARMMLSYDHDKRLNGSAQ